jgi:hypothetical protein
MRTRRTIRYTPSDDILTYAPVGATWHYYWRKIADEARLSRLHPAPREFRYEW